jgi:hypothetical protein
MTQTRLLALALSLAATMGCGGVPINQPCAVDPHGSGCALQVTTAATRVAALSSDGFALVLDEAKRGSVLDLAHGTLTPVTTDVTNAFSSGNVIFTFHGSNTQSSSLPLNIWSAASGARELDPAVVQFSLPRTDGTHVAWMASVANDQNSADVKLGRVDGKSAPVTVLPGMALNGGLLCNGTSVSLAGNRLLVSGCKMGQTQATLQSFDLDSGALIGQVSVAHGGFAVDANGARVLYATVTGGVVSNVDLSSVTSVVSDFKSGKFTPDGNSIIYIDNEGRLARAPINGGHPTILQSGVVDIEQISPDSNWVIYTTKYAPSPSIPTSNLLLASTTTASSAVTLRAATDAALLSDGFTANSAFALYATNLDVQYNGVFSAQPVAGGVPRMLAKLDFYWLAVGGARVVYTDNVQESQDARGVVDSTADIELIDLATSGTPTPLVAQADARVQLTADKAFIVYGIPPGSAHPGIYTMRLP